ncbi:MAG: DUF302 domain-containing protein [Gammaproteobacteria bacterium]|nr:MAG: DUF302 domain-containing protein [Gammaproteobacteria bacterium]
MKQLITTNKPVEQAAADLQAAVQRNGFGVLHVYDLKQTLQSKGYPVSAECRIFEVCNPAQAQRVLNEDMSLCMALPCRIAVFEQAGRTQIGTLSPRALLGLLSDRPELEAVAAEVEEVIGRIMQEAA